MKLPTVTIKQLLEAGVHLGHKTFRWNPKMGKYIFGSKNSIHIIDLVQTLELTNAALHEIYKCITAGGKILFVSTKKQAAETISKLAIETGQYHVTQPVNFGFDDQPTQIDPIRYPWPPILIAPAELHSMYSASQKAVPSSHSPILPYLYKRELSGIPQRCPDSRMLILVMGSL